MNQFLTRHQKRFDRFLEILPGFFAWSIILTPAIGGLFFPKVVAYGILVFITYWFLKSFKSAFYSVFGYVLVREWEKMNYYNKWLESTGSKLNWNMIKHVIIIPNYNETEEKLRKTLQTFANQKQIDKNNLFVFLAMEARAEGSRERAENLIARFRKDFKYIYATYHPDNILGEIRGKGSNEAWAAKKAKEVLDKKGIDMKYVTVTSCDADARFHKLYFAALTHYFATNKNRYKRFWQSPIFWYNNLHRVPFRVVFFFLICPNLRAEYQKSNNIRTLQVTPRERTRKGSNEPCKHYLISQNTRAERKIT